MEQFFLIIQQIYWALRILSSYPQDEREELVEGYQCFLFEAKDILRISDRIVGGSTYWGWGIDWGYQPWQLRTYRQQKGLTLQAGWEDRVNFGLDLYRDIPLAPREIPIPTGPPKVLTPIDLDAIEAEETELENKTDICKVCHIEHERPVAFHEFIPGSSSSSSDIENLEETRELPVIEENSNLDSMPELEDETNLDSIDIPLWLIPNGVLVTFRGG